MEYSQTNIRLSQETIDKIKVLAKRHGFAYSVMCQKILEDALSKLDDLDGESSLLPKNCLAFQKEIENSRERQANLKLEKQYVDHSEKTAAHTCN